jgi:hypothetical protein
MNMKLAWSAAALALLVQLGPTEKAAQAAADVPIAVLGIEASDAPDALASGLTDALRQRVTGTKGFRLVPGRDLVEVKLVFSCPDEAPSCMAQAGKSLGATKLIFGSVKKSIGDSFLVTLKLLDANRSIVDAFVAEQISKAQATGPALRGPVQKWFATLTGQGGAGIIKVKSDVIGAAVTLDGNPSGILGTEDLVLSGVTPGKHEVAISKAGYEPARREVSVGSGETIPVDLKMVRSPLAAAPPAAVASGTASSPRADEPAATVHETRGHEGGTAIKVATWGTAAGAVGAIVLGVTFGLAVQSVNNDLDDLRRFNCMKGGKMVLCDQHQMMAEPLSPAETNYVKLKKDYGQRLELYQYISYGVGGALLLTSGYLFYRAYLDEGDSRASTGSHFTLVPVLSPSSAGAAAFLRF